MINMYYRCGHQFYLRYIKGTKRPPGIHLIKGTGTHAGVEYGYNQKIATGELPPEDEVADAAHDAFVDVVVNGSSYGGERGPRGVWLAPDEVCRKKEILGEALDESIKLAQFYRKVVAPTDKEIALVEERLFADIGVGIPISFKPDVVVDGKLRDVKTAGKRWPKGKEDGEIQPTLYRMGLREHGFGDLNAEFVVLSNVKSKPKDDSGILFDGDLCVIGDPRPTERTYEHEEALKLRIHNMMESINKGVFLPAHPEMYTCSPSWCGYYDICPYMKGRKVI
jgi:hypothetical protein